MNSMNTIKHILFSIVFAVAVFVFWLLGYPEALSLQEQFQLFLFSKSFFLERVSVSGGLADYVAEFLTQFYYHPAVGAFILAIVLVLIQVLVWRLARQLKADDAHYMLSFVPSVMLMAFMGDENVLLSFPVAIIMALAAALLYGRLTRCRILYHCVMIPLLYVVAGPTVIVYVALTSVADVRRVGMSARLLVQIVAMFALVAIVMLVSAYTWLVQYTPTDIVCGVNYHRLRQEVPVMQIVIEAVVALMPLAMSLLPGVKVCLAYGIELLIVGVGAFIGVRQSFDDDKYNLIAFDYLVRGEKWDDIISKAERIRYSDPMACASVNLALAMKGQLPERMFEFYQCGPSGLLTPFVKNQLSCAPTAEAFYRLGMVNAAQWYFFDLQESIINCRKSGRFTKRLVETYIVNGRYEVAQKYIDRLKLSLYYADWAKKAESYLGNEEAINNHPVWGRLRKVQYKDEFLFNHYEMDKMLGILYRTNNSNVMAMEYFFAQTLLVRNLQEFCGYIPWILDRNYAMVPRSYQEALAYVWSRGHSSFEGTPFAISNSVQQNLMSFAKKYMANENDPTLRSDIWKTTYWSYFFFPPKAVDAKTGATNIVDNETEQKR